MIMKLNYDYFLDLVNRLNIDKKGYLTAEEIEEYADEYYSDYKTSLYFGELCGVIKDVVEILKEESQYNEEYKKDLVKILDNFNLL